LVKGIELIEAFAFELEKIDERAPARVASSSRCPVTRATIRN